MSLAFRTLFGGPDDSASAFWGCEQILIFWKGAIWRWAPGLLALCRSASWWTCDEFDDTPPLLVTYLLTG